MGLEWHEQWQTLGELFFIVNKISDIDPDTGLVALAKY